MNEIKVTILDSGAVKIETAQFASASHSIAEKALLWINQELGGEVQKTVIPHTHTHGGLHEHI